MTSALTTVDVTYTHTEGEPTCIVRDGIAYPDGADILAKRRFLETEYDWLRRALMREPRGHNDMFGVFVTPPSSPDMDAGMIWMDGDRFHDMCGHGTIALSIVLAGERDTAAGNTTTLRYETTAGPVTAEVGGGDGAAAWTRFENVPAFVAAREIPVELPGLGARHADVAFGGNSFAQIDLRGTDLQIRPENGRRLRELGLAARDQINARADIRHPTEHHIRGVNFVTFHHDAAAGDALYRGVHVFGLGQLDRSPGGTGTSAMMASLVARSAVGLGRPLRVEGLLGSGIFEAEAVGETVVGGQPALRTNIKGNARITGAARWRFDPDDPVGAGFVVT